MQLIDRTGELRSRSADEPPVRILLHDTAGGSVEGAISTLEYRGLAYHYIIGRDGIVYKLVEPDDYCDHAYQHSRQSVSISTVGGSGAVWGDLKYGAVNAAQTQSIIELSKKLVAAFPTIKVLTGHRDVSPKRKIDPEVLGDYPTYMKSVAKQIGLVYYDHTHFVGG